MSKKIIAVIAALVLCLTNTNIINARAGITYNSTTITTDTDNNGNTTYTNNANGKTFTKYADGTTSGDEDYDIRSDAVMSSYYVGIGDYKEITIYLPDGQDSISNLKVYG